MCHGRGVLPGREEDNTARSRRCAVDVYKPLIQEEAHDGLPETVLACRQGGRLHPDLLGPERRAGRRRLRRPDCEAQPIFGDDVLATAILDRLLHHCEVISINGPSYRPTDHLVIMKGRWAAGVSSPRDQHVLVYRGTFPLDRRHRPGTPGARARSTGDSTADGRGRPGSRIEDVSRLLRHSTVRLTQHLYISADGDLFDPFSRTTE
jgi:hypothetical protein